MKFYIDKKLFACWVKIIKYKLTSIYIDNAGVIFLKNGIMHNAKNAAYISKNNRCRKFFLTNYMVMKIILLKNLGANLLNYRFLYEIL
mgnify:CR=1 FL=1